MRKGRIYNAFGVSQIPGLSNYLSGIDENGSTSDKKITGFIQETSIENLYVISAGNVPPNPAELLVSDRMMDGLDFLKTLFDIIIFDTPPSLLVTDSAILSRLVDTTIIVTEHNKTKNEDLAKVKKDIENVGGKIGGVVINKIPVSVKKYNEAYYYSKTSLKSNEIKKAKRIDEIEQIVKAEKERSEREQLAKQKAEADAKRMQEAGGGMHDMSPRTEEILKQIKEYNKNG